MPLILTRSGNRSRNVSTRRHQRRIDVPRPYPAPAVGCRPDGSRGPVFPWSRHRPAALRPRAVGALATAPAPARGRGAQPRADSRAATCSARPSSGSSYPSSTARADEHLPRPRPRQRPLDSRGGRHRDDHVRGPGGVDRGARDPVRRGTVFATAGARIPPRPGGQERSGPVRGARSLRAGRRRLDRWRRGIGSARPHGDRRAGPDGGGACSRCFASSHGSSICSGRAGSTHSWRPGRSWPSRTSIRLLSTRTSRRWPSRPSRSGRSWATRSPQRCSRRSTGHARCGWRRLPEWSWRWRCRLGATSPKGGRSSSCTATARSTNPPCGNVPYSPTAARSPRTPPSRSGPWSTWRAARSHPRSTTPPPRSSASTARRVCCCTSPSGGWRARHWWTRTGRFDC